MPRHSEDEDDLDGPKPINLSRGLVAMKPETIIRLGWGLVVVGATAAAAVITQLNGIHNDVTKTEQTLREEIATCSRKIESRTNDRWTLSMQREWRYGILQSNPTIKAPDPDEIAHRILPLDTK